MSLNGKTAVVTGAGSGAEEANYVTGQTIGVNGGRYLVSFNAETRKQTGRGAGDEVDVELVADPDR